MKATSARRQLIVFVLLGLALAGAALRHWADNPSVARDIGTLLLVLWLPVIGHVVGFVIARVRSARRSRATAVFAPETAFSPHLQVEVMPLATQPRAAPATGERTCTVVVGHEGFTARAATPLAEWIDGAPTVVIALQLLRPALALQRLRVGTTFSLLAGPSVVGTGRVLQVHQPGSGP